MPVYMAGFERLSELNQLEFAPSQLLRSTGFSRISPVANLLLFIWTGQHPIFFSQVPANFFFIVMTTGQESKPVF